MKLIKLLSPKIKNMKTQKEHSKKAIVNSKQACEFYGSKSNR